MPTKIRYLLSYKATTGEKAAIYSGSQVVARLCGLRQKDVMSTGFPPLWYKLSKREKIKSLMSNLSPKYSLTVFREPKWCRKNRSLYLKAMKASTKINDLDAALRYPDPPQVIDMRNQVGANLRQDREHLPELRYEIVDRPNQGNIRIPIDLYDENVINLRGAEVAQPPEVAPVDPAMLPEHWRPNAVAATIRAQAVAGQPQPARVARPRVRPRPQRRVEDDID